MPGKESAKDLLKHFDQESARKLAQLVNQGGISLDHVREIIRLTASLPEYRDPDTFDSLLEDAEEMDATAFKLWVQNSLDRKRG